MHLLAAGRHADALPHLEAARKLLTPDCETILAIGHCLRLAGRAEEAERAYRDAHAADRDSVDARTILASSVVDREPAEALKLTATDLDALKVIDRIVEEPKGGAHRDVDTMAANLGLILQQELQELEEVDREVLLENRFQKFLHMGVFADAESGL